jgi:segregation and condensation protein B
VSIDPTTRSDASGSPATNGGSTVPSDPTSVGATSSAVLDPTRQQGLEAILFLADEPVPALALAELLEVSEDAVVAALEELAVAFERDGRGMCIRQVAGGWRMYTAPAAGPILERWVLAGRTGRLTQAALETLAVIAYKQPISRQEIGDIRGVNADGAVRSLVARGFVTEVGRDDGPGQAVLYGTSPLLLERLGLDQLEDLPPLTEYLPEAPAPDEPELGALKEVRRRLAAGDELPSRTLGGRGALETNTGTGDEEAEDADDDALPPPELAARRSRRDDDIDALTDRLEQAAQNAMGRLRAAVAAGEEDGGEEDGDAATGEDAASQASSDDGSAPDDDDGSVSDSDDGSVPDDDDGSVPDDDDGSVPDEGRPRG